MPSTYTVVERPELTSPALVVVLDGWVDAGLGAQNARQVLIDGLDTVIVAEFDPELLLDQRARRPVMHLRDGILEGLSWPSTELRAATDLAGNDLLLLVGSEPDHYWRRFATDVVELAVDFGARMVVTLGAYPAPVPHTRPTRLASSASDADVARHCEVRSTVDVPAGIHAVIEHQADAVAGVPAIGLWAQVPHYASAMPCPPASVALLDGLATVAGVRVPYGDLRELADLHRRRLDDLVAANPEHVEMVRRLEQEWDAEAAAAAGGTRTDTAALGPLPSGDELAAELERFLREQ